MDLVIDVGNSRVKLGFFENEKLVGVFTFLADPFPADEFIAQLRKATIEKALLCSVNPAANEKVLASLKQGNITAGYLKVDDFEKSLDVVDKKEIGADRIANIYGALARCPVNDCIVVDVGTAVTFDFIAKNGVCTGGAIYPGMRISAHALAEKTQKLPLIKIEKPRTPLGKTTEEQIQSGIYYGLLGAIERMVAELRLSSDSPSSVSILATGGMTDNEEFQDDLMEFVDVVDPHLTLMGLYQILKERR